MFEIVCFQSFFFGRFWPFFLWIWPEKNEQTTEFFCLFGNQRKILVKWKKKFCTYNHLEAALGLSHFSTIFCLFFFFLVAFVVVVAFRASLIQSSNEKKNSELTFQNNFILFIVFFKRFFLSLSSYMNIQNLKWLLFRVKKKREILAIIIILLYLHEMFRIRLNINWKIVNEFVTFWYTRFTIHLKNWETKILNLILNQEINKMEK